ncbi:MAG: hypothetical protein LBB74_01245 [Chitinispirillales bacterium]|nr:hypothetical protein [Chitinispirillales bacterium]
MSTLVIDRQTLPEPLLSFIGAERIRVDGEAGKIILTPAADDEADAGCAERRARRRAAFDRCRLDLTGFRFNRDEANDY